MKKKSIQIQEKQSKKNLVNIFNSKKFFKSIYSLHIGCYKGCENVSMCFVVAKQKYENLIENYLKFIKNENLEFDFDQLNNIVS